MRVHLDRLVTWPDRRVANDSVKEATYERAGKVTARAVATWLQFTHDTSVSIAEPHEFLCACVHRTSSIRCTCNCNWERDYHSLPYRSISINHALELTDPRRKDPKKNPPMICFMGGQSNQPIARALNSIQIVVDSCMHASVSVAASGRTKNPYARGGSRAGGGGGSQPGNWARSSRSQEQPSRIW